MEEYNKKLQLYINEKEQLINAIDIERLSTKSEIDTLIE